MRRKIKWILLIIAFLIVTCAVWYFFSHQPEAKIIDEIKNGKLYKEENSAGGASSNEDTAVLNENVHFYTDDNAKKINREIIDVNYVDDELIVKFDSDTDTELAALKEGELFWLEGDKDTPLKDTYIGKVVSNTVSEKEILLSIKAPMLDEVFDELYLHDEMQINPSNINNISTIEGVTITPVNSISADFLEATDAQETREISNLIYNRVHTVETVKTASSELGDFIVEFNTDIGELLDIVQNTELIPGFETTCTLTGKMGLEDLRINYNADWNKGSYGMRELSVGVSGKQVAKAEFKLSVDGEVVGDKTKWGIGTVIKMQGLEEKLFPIAYFDCTPAKVVSLKPNTAGKIGTHINKKIKESYEIMPLSCGFMVYIDIYGNLSMKFTMDYEYSDKFENKLVLVRDNKFVSQFEGMSKPKETYTSKLEAQADADIHIGASAMAYFFNVNMADVAIAKIGTEAEGKGVFQATSDEEADSGVDASFYARLYLKAIDVKARLKVQVNLWKLFSEEKELSFEGTLLDMTLAETGQHKDTHYDKEVMTWQKMTGEDKDAIYYKGLNGQLFREDKRGYSRKVIYDNEFFSICGLDQSYVYLLQAVDDEKYNVRRVNKDGTTSKIILKDVKYVLMMEGQDLYYVPSFSPKDIYVLDRTVLREDHYISFPENVEYMANEKDGFYVVTQKKDAFSWFFGPECTYYRISNTGEILQTYDNSLSPEETMKEEFEQYWVGYKFISNGYLRETAQDVYWLSKNQGKFVETEGISGWHPTEAGIFTEQDNEDGDHEVILYEAEEGTPRRIINVSGTQTFFTFVQDKKKNWYYMDQTETDFELYKMNSEFGNVKLINKISRNKIVSVEEECSMEIVDNKIFFYTMPEWSKSQVLYRHNLY